MTSTFSLSRLGKLITKQFFENSRLYLFSVLALFGLLALVFTFWLSVGGPNYHEEQTYMIGLFGLFISGSIFASMSFNMLGSKDKGIYWLSIPATHLEKLICTIFYTTVVFMLAYCVCFFVVKSIALTFLTAFIDKHPGNSYTEIKDFGNGFAAAIKYFLYLYFAVQSLYMLGSVYFSRYSFVVTTVVGSAVIFAVVYYVVQIQHTMEGSWDLVYLRKYDPAIKDSYMLYSISPAITNVLKYTLQFAWAPVFWVVTWFRLREKEL